MQRRAYLVLFVPIFAGLAVAWPEKGERTRDGESRIAYEKLPGAVKEAVRRHTAIDAITEIDEVTRNGRVTYDVEFRRGGKKDSITVTGAGDLIVHEHPVEASELPNAVRAAISKKFPGARVEGASAIAVRFFKVRVVVEGRKPRVVKVLASGRLDEDDDEDDDDDDEDDDNEDDNDDDD